MLDARFRTVTVDYDAATLEKGGRAILSLKGGELMTNACLSLLWTQALCYFYCKNARRYLVFIPMSRFV